MFPFTHVTTKSYSVVLSAKSLRVNNFDVVKTPKINASLPFLLNWLPTLQHQAQKAPLHDREFCETDDDCHKYDPASYCEDGPGKQPVDVWNWFVLLTFCQIRCFLCIYIRGVVDIGPFTCILAHPILVYHLRKFSHGENPDKYCEDDSDCDGADYCMK